MDPLFLDPVLRTRATTALTQARQAPASESDGARRVAEEFESVFLFEVLASMYEGMGTDGAFGGGQTERTFRSMLNEEVAKSISRAGGVGIADAIYSEIVRLQEVAS